MPGFLENEIVFFWVAVGLSVLGLLMQLLQRRIAAGSPRRFLLGRFIHLFLTTGVLLLLWAGAAREDIPWLQSSLVAWLLLLGFLVWLGFILRYQLKSYKAQLRAWQEQELKSKYLKRSK